MNSRSRLKGVGQKQAYLRIQGLGLVPQYISELKVELLVSHMCKNRFDFTFIDDFKSIIGLGYLFLTNCPKMGPSRFNFLEKYTPK